MNGVVAEQPAAVASVKPQVIPLTSQESAALRRDEEIIQRHVETYKDAGAAFAEIRDKRLYRTQYSSFEVYCRMKWEMSKTQVNRLIAAAKTVRELKEGLAEGSPELAAIVEHLPESAIRPLTMLKPSEQKKTLQKATKTAPGGLTARLIAQTAREVAPKAFAKTDSRRKPDTTGGRSGRAPEGDLIRRSEVLEEINKWEKAQKATGKLDSLTPSKVLLEVRRIIHQVG